MRLVPGGGGGILRRFMAANTAILSELACSSHHWPVSVSAYHALGEAGLVPRHTELLYGFIFTQVAASPLHTLLVSRLLRVIEESVAEEAWWVRPAEPLTFPDSETVPDISILPSGLRAAEGGRKGHPCTASLVVEVADHSAPYDRGKAALYAHAGVKEFWILLGGEHAVEVYQEPAGAGYQCWRKITSPGTLASHAIPGLTLPLATLFSR